MNPAAFTDKQCWIDEELDAIAEQGLLRRRTAIERPRPGRLSIDGREYVDFASNDYLGLAADPRLADAARIFLDDHSWGGGASPLVVGFHPIVERLERELAQFEGAESALLFASGFAANLGVLSSLVGREDVLFSEHRNHASLIDGCRLSRSDVRVYRGDRLEELENALRSTVGFRRRWIATDSVFSMEGDAAPLAELCDLADRYDAILYVDESHATGVLGKTGRGLAEELGVEHRIPLRMGTCSKAMGSVGGFVVGSARWIELLINRARSYIFSTASPPVCAAGTLVSLDILKAEPNRRDAVHRQAARLRAGLHSLGLSPGASRTPIVPVIVGEPRIAVAAAVELRRAGFWVGAIRPPSVEPGSSRLRLSVSAAHQDADVDLLLQSLAQCMSKNCQ